MCLNFCILVQKSGEWRTFLAQTWKTHFLPTDYQGGQLRPPCILLFSVFTFFLFPGNNISCFCSTPSSPREQSSPAVCPLSKERDLTAGTGLGDFRILLTPACCIQQVGDSQQPGGSQHQAGSCFGKAIAHSRGWP